MKRFMSFALGTLFLALINLSMANSVESASGFTFPAEVQFENNGSEVILDLAGAAIRTKFFLNLYAIGYYLHNPLKMKRAAALDELVKDGKIKQFTIKWLYETDFKTTQKAFLAGFQKVVPAEEYQRIEPLIKKYLSFYTTGIKKGDVHILRWLPGNIITLEVNGDNKGEIAHPVFAKCVWRLWFDSTSIMNQNNLVKNLLN
ncbi:chalcone isomerase family protein [Parachlamydia sp. AcF125]|uniref:chalcone isomerase family protein n=1 Tax=Parachlamydia sp. AcF125 TaxID=2795736 RepID=UPI001BCA2023|nr:chalcone isomerase family protein [Parachlamydia sp. AcF125]